MKVVQDIDVDDVTARIDPQGKLESRLVFTDKEVTINLGNGIQLIYRQLLSSNRTMVNTGVQFNGTWYGDAPDDQPYQDVFTGRTLQNVKLVPGTIVDEPQIYRPKAKIIVRELNGGVNVIFQLTGQSANVQDFAIRGMGLGSDFSYSAEVDGYVLNSGNTIISFTESLGVSFTYNGTIYTGEMPRVAFDGMLGTYEVAGDTFDDVLRQFNQSQG